MFLPVEHMEPWTEASTTAIRDYMRSLGQLRVRELGVDNATMLSRREMESRAKSIEARRREMEHGIAVMREGFDQRRWLSGRVSTLQASGAYVSLVEGKDAFVPVSEMPGGGFHASGGKASGDDARPTLQMGQRINYRVIRHSRQNDTFVASMIPYEESVARNCAARGDPQRSTSASSTARSNAGRITLGAASRSVSVPRPRSATQGEPQALDQAAQRWANKGFTVISGSAADELNDWLRQGSDQVGRKSSQREGPRPTERKFIVNIVRGMTSKVVGQVALPARASEQEVKDAALEMTLAQGLIKKGKERTSITVGRNTVTVKASGGS